MSVFLFREKLRWTKYEKWPQNTAAPKKRDIKRMRRNYKKLFYLIIYDLGEIMLFAID